MSASGSNPKGSKMKLPPGFKRLSPCVSIYDPSSSTSSSIATTTTTTSHPPPNTSNATTTSPITTSSPLPLPGPLPPQSQPTLLILCTWANASPTHIAKYTTAYAALMPQTRILLIQGTMYDLFFRPEAAQRAELRAAVDVVRGVIAESVEGEGGKGKGKPHGIFVHMLSSGGVHKGTLLARMLLPSPTPTPTSLPDPPGLHPHAILVDSAPTLGNDTRTFFVPAVLASFPPLSTPVRFLAVLAVNAFWCFVYMMSVVGLQNPVQKVAGRLLDGRLFGKEDGKGLGDGESKQGRTRWGYIYSAADKVVGVEDVRWHIARARAMGRDVAVERCFERSGHVNHLREEGGVYWELVKELLSEDGGVEDMFAISRGNGLR